MAKFGAKLGKSKKTDNNDQAMKAKVELRQKVLEAIPSAHVFDAFAGSGKMHDAVWHRAASYVGCDLRWFRDQRRVFVANNLRVLRAIPLEPYNVFDLDAYGAPWEQAIVILERRAWRSGELVAFILTDGSGLRLRFGGLPKSTQALARLPMDNLETGFGRREWLFDRCIAGVAKRANADVTMQFRAKGKTGSGMLYGCIVLKVR